MASIVQQSEQMLPTFSQLALRQSKKSAPAQAGPRGSAKVRGRHEAPAPLRPVHASDLAAAFADFMSASSRLELSYCELQQELAELRLELARQNAALKQIVDAMPCGVLVFDGRGIMSMMNRECMRLLDMMYAGEQWNEGMTVEGLSSHCGMNLALLCASDDDYANEFCVEQEDGVRWIEGRSRRLTTPDTAARECPAMILILRDITAQKRAEQDREAGRNAMALAEISAELAHEIRNPLASLELFAGLLDDSEGDQKQWTLHLRAGIRSLSTIVNNVLALRSGGLRMEPVQLSAAIAAALKLAEPLLQQARLSLDWRPECEELIGGNPSALQQLLMNLVSNAVRHTPAGGSIQVSLRREQGSLQGDDVLALEFADSGCGIPSHQMDRIFDRGYSGSGASGLGLAVCEQIMKEHCGSISAVNGANEGALFRLEFPLLMENANV